MTQKADQRMLWIDNIRLVMIVLVVMIHANCTYSGFGMWYYRDSAGMGPVQSLLMGIFGSFTQAYFMGLLFFIAGYFVPAAYESKGFLLFLKDRLVRLGAPSLLYMLVIHPLMVAYLLRGYYSIGFPLRWLEQYYASFSFIGSTGPLWFAVALLAFTLVYSLLREAGLLRGVRLSFRLRHRHIIGFIAVVAAASFFVRIVQPIGTSVLNMQLCYFSQYIALFSAGIFARQADVLGSLDRRIAMRWFIAAAVFGTIVWLALMLFCGPAAGDFRAINGNGTWQSALYALWESFFCAGVCLGLIVIFRDGLNAQNRAVKFLSTNAFGVYVLHAPVLVAVSICVSGLTFPPLEKALIAGSAALIFSFAAAVALRTLPGVKRII